MSVTLTCSKVNQCHLFTDIKRNNTDQQVLKVKYLDSFKVDPWRYAYINKCMVPFGVRVWNRKPKIEGFRSWITHGCKKWWLDFKKVTEQRPNFLIEGYFLTMVQNWTHFLMIMKSHFGHVNDDLSITEVQLSIVFVSPKWIMGIVTNTGIVTCVSHIFWCFNYCTVWPKLTLRNWNVWKQCDLYNWKNDEIFFVFWD